jgi:RHS repeat-associated protein
MRRDGELLFLRPDHLGWASLLLDEDGRWLADHRFYPYGEIRRSDGASATNPTDRMFTGMLLDPYIKLTIMGSRWYDAALSRWLSADRIVPDPANPQSLNRYTWVLGRALILTDPTGHFGARPDKPMVEGTCLPGACLAHERLLGHIIDVDVVTVKEPERPFEGDFEWAVRFELAEPALADGHIIQHVREDVFLITENGELYENSFEFYEAWSVGEGDTKATPGRGWPWTRYNDEWEVTLTSDLLLLSIETTGTVAFYEGSLPDDFQAGKVLTAGDLVSSRKKPVFWSGRGTKRHMDLGYVGTFVSWQWD